jgi:serine/threonine protein kinase
MGRMPWENRSLMATTQERSRLGPYVLTRPLARHPLAARWLALHERDESSHIAYQFPVCRDKAEQRRFLTAAEALAKVSHPHILRPELYTFDTLSHPWIICPFSGDADGVRPLSRLLRDKGGQLMLDEAQRAISQLLEAVTHAHEQGAHHGPLDLDDVLVTRFGGLEIELYGLSRQLRGLNVANQELVRDEIRSIVEIGYQLVTGLRCEAPIIPAQRLVKRLPMRWAAWLDQGLDPSGGFESPDEALAALHRPEVQVVRRPVLAVRDAFGLRFRAGE